MTRGHTRSVYKACGFVLHAIDYGESDRIVTFYTDTLGKLRGIAKGARRSKKRFANAIEIFSCSSIIFSRKTRNSLALIENCDVIDHYPAIREDLEKTLIASYLIELVDKFTLEGTKNLKIFQLVHNFLNLIENGYNSEEIVRFFELRLLRLAGYEPALEHCISCNTHVDNIDTPWFNPADGGIRCSRCRTHDAPSCIPVSPGTIKALLMGKDLGIDKIHRLVFSRQSLNESRQILSRFIEQVLGREVKSLRVLNEIRRLTL